MEQFKKQYFLLFIFCLVSAGYLFAQDYKKADDFFRLKSYAEAIPLYEKGLAEKENYSARSKLAFSYKMLNKTDKAVEQYAMVIKDERVRPEDFFYYGEALMSQAKYEEAKTWFLKFHEKEPDEEKGLRMAEACDQIPFLTSLFPTAKIMEFPYNTAYDDTSPVFYNNEVVFSSDRKAGVKFLKQKSGTTGRDFIRLYSSTLNEKNEWSEPVSFSNKLNENNKNNANASFLPDGSAVYFTRNGNVSNRNNAFTLQLYGSTIEKGKWKDVELLSVCKPGHNYMHPAISPDGKTLFFVSDKPGGKGGTDIYYAEKKGEEWGRVVNLDTMINTSAHEGFPFMSEDGKLYFCSKGHIGYGGFDIFVTEKKKDGTWAKPSNVGQPINSPLDDISIFINKDNTKGAFTSARSGNGDDIFLFSLDGSEPVAASQAVAPTEMVAATSEIPDNTFPIETEVAETEMAKVEPPVIKELPQTANEPILETTPIATTTTTKTVEEPATKNNTPSKPIVENVVPDNGKVATFETTKSKPTEKTVASSPVVEPPQPTMEVTPVGKIEEPSTVTTEEIKTERPAQKSQELPSVNNNPDIGGTTNTISSEQPKTEGTAVEHNETAVMEQEVPAQKIMTEDILEVKETTISEVSSLTEGAADKEEDSANDMVEWSGSKEGMSAKAFQKAVVKGKYEAGMMYVLEEMRYFPGEYLLVPKMTLQLEPIVKMLQEQPELKLEISVHTESIGYDKNNLDTSQKRAKAIKNYLLYKGIEATRVNAIGLGESQLVNHCGNGVVCTEEEHLANQRVEVRVR